MEQTRTWYGVDTEMTLISLFFGAYPQSFSLKNIEFLCLLQNSFYLCTRFSEIKHSGCSAVRLAHLLWEQGVVGSNPATPTKV